MASLKILTFFVFTLQCIIANGQQPMSRLNFFDIDLLRYCAEERRGNVMVSPASIKATLAMLLEGSKGATEAEIRSALRLSPVKDDYREQIHKFLEGLKTKTSGVILQNANSVFVSERYKLKQEYEKMIKQVYLAEILKMNFTDVQISVNMINKWVVEKTNGLIPQIVDPVTLNPSTEMLLANAMYFKGKWLRPFSPQETNKACFYDHGTCRKVQMMYQRAEMKYAFLDELRAHAVELPYEGSRYSMILLVPLDRDGCAPLIRDLPYMSLDKIIGIMDPYDVQLAMPKFTVDYSENMVGPLKSMRISTLFSSSANLTGIFEGVAPYVNSMYHKVHMSVDEQGTVAAAATAAMVIPLIENGVQLRVDRPFVFFIRDNDLGVVLFEGRIEDPTPFVEPVKAQTTPPLTPAQLIPAALPPTQKPAQSALPEVKPIAQVEPVKPLPEVQPIESQSSLYQPSKPLLVVWPVESQSAQVDQKTKTVAQPVSSPSEPLDQTSKPLTVVWRVEPESDQEDQPAKPLVQPVVSQAVQVDQLAKPQVVWPVESEPAQVDQAAKPRPIVQPVESQSASLDSLAEPEPRPSVPLPHLPPQPIQKIPLAVPISLASYPQTTKSPPESEKSHHDHHPYFLRKKSGAFVLFF